MPRSLAPELDPKLVWLNTPRPIRLHELRGQLVILGFFSHASVGAAHAWPLYRALVSSLRNEPVVLLGVQTGDLALTHEPSRVAVGIETLDIDCPVLIDREQTVRNDFAVRTLPSLIIIKPDGGIAAMATREPDVAILGAYIRSLLDDARKDGSLATSQHELPTTRPHNERLLAHPTKAAISPTGMLAVSDTGHHRVLVFDAHGAVAHVIGSGERGLAEGSFEVAKLEGPQGLAWDGHALWIADAKNHVLLHADLSRGSLTLRAGTGKLAKDASRGRKQARATALRSPWDVCVVGDMVLLALRGSHQIACFDKTDDSLDVLCGSGREACVDGPPTTACFAEPTGLALIQDTLYVADSASQAIRAISLTDNEARTLVPPGRLVRPHSIVSYDKRSLLLVDTVLGELLRVDVKTRAVTRLYVGEGPLKLAEPTGLGVFPNGDVLVVDIAQHRLTRLSKDGVFLETLAHKDLPRRAPARVEPKREPGASASSAVTRGRGVVALRRKQTLL